MTLILKTLPADMKAYGGFVWPSEIGAVVTAPDWDPTPICGGGLHGLAHGEGSVELLHAPRSAETRWVVFDADEIVDLGGKVKARSGVIRCVGGRSEALAFLGAHDPGHAAVYGTATAGYGGMATAGDGGTATAGARGTATAGYGGMATAGDGGTATAGARGTAIAGDGGTATAGGGGTATAGDEGTAIAGGGGTVQVRWLDSACGRYRVAIGYPGEDGIKAGVAYRADSAGRLVPAAPVTGKEAR